MPRHGALVDTEEIPSLAILYEYDGFVPLADTPLGVGDRVASPERY